ncbi:MAG: AAA family ATPase, partial [Muribaculaceae bacterium]|nr:AAA family ATPase [Muribaculaceae bacterium]
MTPIFLIGYMGCGKTTLGRAVGRMDGVNFIELDSYIENRFHATVGELFASRGEDGF